VVYRGASRAPKNTTRSKADAKKRAQEALAKARAGADFGALAAEYSDDTGTKDRLGNVGKFTRDKVDKAFADAAFALAEGEISEVVESPFGFHIIKRNQ
jgi:peptidyl-prolyl cis-trans isomerase NIMA-interacting 1